MNPETWLHQLVHNITMYHLYILIRDIDEDRQPEYLKCYAKVIEPSVIEFLQFLDSYKIIEVTQFKDCDYKEGYKVLQRELKNLGEHIPPLINSYMNLSPSMKMFGTAINTEFGKVEESGILVHIPDIYPEKIERYIAPLVAWAQKIRVKWWRRK